MKRVLSVLFLLLVVFPIDAQNSATKKVPVNAPEIQFEKLYFDFGELKVGDVKEVTLAFKNTGTKPLILDDVISSCDCTVVDWPRSPVMPGKTAKITAKYTAESVGLISKRVTVLSNAETDRVVLQLKGTVK